MKFYQRSRRMPQVMIVSLIDIFAILLIFVIVTTTFKTAQPAVTIKLPESKTAVAAEGTDAPTILSVAENEEIFLGEKKLALEELGPALNALRRGEAKISLGLKIDKKVSYGFFVRVTDALKQAGIKGNLSAFTEPTK